MKNGRKKKTETTCTLSYDKKAIYKISNQSDERCKRSCSCGKRLDGQKDGWNEGMKDGQMHTQTDEGHFYSPPLPMSGENK